MVGAVAGSPGTLPTNWVNSQTAGLSRQIVGVGTENGLQYIDLRFFGTTNTGDGIRIDLETGTSIAAATGQTWTYSLYAKLISGTIPTTSFVFFERNAGGSAVTSGGVAFLPTSTLSRFNSTRTLSGGVTVAFVQTSLSITTANATAYDFTIRIAAPQMELGAYATTFIKTSTAAVTRVADNYDKTGVDTFLGANSGTWFIEIANNTAQIRDASSPNQLSLSNLSSDLFELRNLASTSSRLSARIALAGSAIFTTLINTDKAKIAFVYNGSTCSIFINGVKVASRDFAVNSFDRLRTTTTDNMKQLDDMALIPRALPDAEAIQITTL
jgi:hypothetical protein